MRRWVVGLMVLGLIGASCDAPNTAVPGAAPLRYRDQVFADTSVVRDVPYSTVVSQAGETVELRLDVYTPTGDPVTSRPAIVWIHGGSFRAGGKGQSNVVTPAKAFARRGFVSVSINYRLVTGGCSGTYLQPTCVQAMIDSQHDAQAAVRFLRANADSYGIDPTRIAVAGISAGGIIAMHVAFNADDPGESGNLDQPSAVQAAIGISSAKRLGTADAGEAPTLQFHGALDTTVPYQWAVDTYDEATAAGLDTFLVTFAEAGHAIASPYAAEIDARSVNFLFWEMKLADAAR